MNIHQLKRRYMNVNVHTNGSLYNLGLVRVVGSMPSEKAVQIVSGKFFLSLSQQKNVLLIWRLYFSV